MRMLDSDTVLGMDVTVLADTVSSGPFLYRPTEGELSALVWIGKRYSVSELLCGALSYDSHDQAILYIDPFEVGYALSADSVDRVPCLSDDTALQRIVWCIGPADNEE